MDAQEFAPINHTVPLLGKSFDKVRGKSRTNLTYRQMEVLRLRKRGLTQEKVAKLLGTSR
jgi:DNA-binding CsgD family transcriptional regulator